MSEVPEETPEFIGSYPGGPTRGRKGGTSRFRGVREKEGARSRMVRRDDRLEKKIRYVLAAAIGMTIAVASVTRLSQGFEPSSAPEVEAQTFEQMLESERKHILGELWKMEAVEALR